MEDIETYFDTITKEQFIGDLLEAGFTINEGKER
jgi:hypothetical protein